MSMEVRQSHGLKGGATSGRTVISIPEIPAPAPNHRNNLISETTRKRNRQIPRLQKSRMFYCLDKGVVLARVGGRDALEEG